MATASAWRCTAAADRPDDQVWYLSTRSLGYATNSIEFHPRVAQYDYHQGWVSSDLETLLQSEARLTVIYVHGNRMSHANAVDRGLAVYRSLIANGAPPIRMLIWSWPSDRIGRRPLRDVRVKAQRAQAEGVYLGRFLNRIPPDRTVSLVGYSYGSRVIGSALHVLGGGTINGRGLGSASVPTGHWLRATLIAPAIDRDAFARGSVYQNAVGVVEHPQVLFNPCDPVLKRYRFIERCKSNEQAMGFAGIIGGMPVAQYNVGSYIGKSHDEHRYLGSSAIMGPVRRYLLWQE